MLLLLLLLSCRLLGGESLSCWPLGRWLLGGEPLSCRLLGRRPLSCTLSTRWLLGRRVPPALLCKRLSRRSLSSPPALLCEGLGLGPLSYELLSCEPLGCRLLSCKPPSCQWLRR